MHTNATYILVSRNLHILGDKLNFHYTRPFILITLLFDRTNTVSK